MGLKNQFFINHFTQILIFRHTFQGTISKKDTRYKKSVYVATDLLQFIVDRLLDCLPMT